MFRYLLFFTVLFSASATVAQNNNMGVGTQTPHPSAKLDVESSEQGFLSPRMTSIQRDAIVNPAEGLLVYDTSDSSFWFFDGIIWQTMETESPDFPSHIIATDLSQSGIASEGPVLLGSELIAASNFIQDGEWIEVHAFGSITSDSSSIGFDFEGNELLFNQTEQGVFDISIKVYRENNLRMKAIGVIHVGNYSSTQILTANHNFDADMNFQINVSQFPALLNGISVEGYSIKAIY